MRSIRWVTITVVAMSASVSAHAAGYVACAAASPEQGKVFYAEPFAGEATATAVLTARYVAMLRDKRYAAPSMYAPPGSPPPPLEASCIWRETEAAAKLASQGMVATARDRRLAPFGTAFTGE